MNNKQRLFSLTILIIVVIAVFSIIYLFFMIVDDNQQICRSIYGPESRWIMEGVNNGQCTR